MAKPIPSDAQAKVLAATFVLHLSIRTDGGYIDPTIAACLKRGWLAPTGECGNYPNGSPYRKHTISEDGMDALETWLRERRYKRSTPTPGGAG